MLTAMVDALSEQATRPRSAPEGRTQGTGKRFGHPKGGVITHCLLAGGMSDGSDLWMHAAKWQSNQVHLIWLICMK